MVKRGRIVAFFLLVLLIAGSIGTTIQSVTKDTRLGLDLQGGFEILYEVTPLEESSGGEDDGVNRETLEATVQALRQRVDVLGISETSINIEGEDRIRVKLAGIEDQDKARELLSTSATLSFRDVNDEERLSGNAVVDGSAKQDFHPDTKEPIVSVRLESAEKFGQLTSEIKDMQNPDTPYPDNKLVIWLDYEEGDSYAEEVTKEDPKYISDPSVTETLRTSNVMITGSPFTIDEAKELADILNAGALPVKMEEIYSNSVGAQFGEKALDKTITAGFIGIGVILIFMMAYYRLPGVVAAITLSLYIFLILVVFNALQGVLTLPGIAALVLGVGMAVDANIITYERIKEELKAGKSILSAYRSGNNRSLATILDANITTLIAAIVLFSFGTSSVKGFATMLIMSILLSFITAVYGSRLLLGLWVKSRALNKKPGLFGLKASQIQNIEDGEEVEPLVFGRSFDFVKHRKKFFSISIGLVLAGVIAISTLGLNVGIDFTSGSRIEVLSDGSITTEKVQSIYEELELEPESIVLSGDNDDIAVARFDTNLDQGTIEKVNQAFEDELGNRPKVSTVSPIVGQELVENAIYAVAIASVGIIIYVTLRFEIYYALTAIIALLHDAFFIVALFSVTRVEFDITIIAAILTIVGYSVNDTIVTFDRIRENVRAKKRVKSFEELAQIVNRSLMQTLGRSINTVLTVVFAALALLLFGANSITNFSFALVVGLAAGTYSSMFIAAQLWLVWRGRNLDKKPIIYKEKKQTGGPQV
ncbi:preprotein translocase subunit SecD [Pontibacillus halophilus JSM 076056 = DSM 19796]|uniref:Multifunctional fusion protein n=1 Tax=Pontibacillus halophilus JSM 076056 = DSM 19796 TaxID=1385510 RepID=A0A0A5ICH5_9BACI|nr:protein translocase subunit SecDF [Pontibacillus halophilus]KGX93512.1 preprotein translocase subunit SecD [Pontibacillus halophilus JSM 076056 = DSM 19796]